MRPCAAPPGDDREGRRSLPLAGRPPARSDALRNRARLLDAAARLIAECGVEGLTMEAVACAASVGKGTVFRRFGDRAGLLLALLDQAERRYQEAFLSGPPPLGPGACPVRRLEAFGVATLRHLSGHRDLYLAVEAAPHRRFVAPPHQVRRGHLAMLLREAGTRGDTELLAEVLLAQLDTALIHHLTTRRAMPLERLEGNWCDLVARIAGRRPVAE